MRTTHFCVQVSLLALASGLLTALRGIATFVHVPFPQSFGMCPAIMSQDQTYKVSGFPSTTCQTWKMYLSRDFSALMHSSREIIATGGSRLEDLTSISRFSGNSPPLGRYERMS